MDIKTTLLHRIFSFPFSLEPRALSLKRRTLLLLFIIFTLSLEPLALSPVYAASKGNPPVAYWRFDEGGGATAYDDTSYNNDLTFYHEVSYKTGKFGKCLLFDGYDDVAICNSSSGDELNPATAITISAWIYVNGAKSGNRIVTKGWGDAYEFKLDANNKLMLEITNASTQSVTSNTALQNSRWYHVAGTYDQQNLKVYINGAFDNSFSSTMTIAQNSHAVAVGGIHHMDTGYTGNGFNGKIDDIKIYNYARTADQIMVDYNAGSAVYLGAGADPNEGNPPILYLKFDENTGTTVYDRSGNNNNGSFTGSPTFSQGKEGSCINFPTDGDYINVPQSSTINLGTSDFSVVSWVNIPKPVTLGSGIFGRYAHSTSYNGCFVVGISDDTTSLFFHHRNTSGSIESYNFNYSLYFSKWVHMAWVKSGTKLYLYLNGQLMQSWTPSISFDVTFANGGNYMISNTGWSPGVMTSLMVDEHKLYNYARTPSQVAYDYNKGKPIAHYKFDEGGGAISHNDYSSADTGIAPVGWWRMDTASSGSANGTNNILDESGNANHGSGNYGANLTGMSWTTGKIGNGALSFDGVDDYVTLGSSSSLRPDNITVEGWYYPTELNTAKWFHLIGLGNWNTDYSLFKNNDAGNKLWWSITTTTGNSSISSDDNVFSLNTWCHVTATYDGSYIKMYINGILHKSAAKTGNMNYANTTVYLAKSGSGYLAGSLDDFRVYNYARTAEQIYNDYKTTHGTLVNHAKFIDGKIGKAMQMDGTDDYILANNLNLDISKDFTVEAWVNPAITQTSNARILSYAQDANNGLSLVTDIDLGNKFLFEVKKGGTTYGGNGIVYSTNTWYHLTGVFTAATNSAVLYVNGVAQGTGSAALTLPPTTGFLYIGCRGDSSYWNGKVDDVRIYNYTRTADQIMQDYNAGATTRLGAQSAGVADPWGGALPVAYWTLDENTGVMAKDASGNGNNGTLGIGGYQPSWVNGKHGPALQFDGSDHVAITDTPAFSFTTGFTIEAWVYATSWVSPGGHNTIVGKENEFLLAVNNSGNLANYIWAGTGWTMDSNQPAMSLNRWVHMALTYDGSKICSYLDGVLQGTGTAKTGNMGDTANVLGIGKRDLASYQPFAAGKIDDVRIYNYARTPAQIAWDYNRGKPVAHWRFNEATTGSAHNQTIYDDSDNNNDGAGNYGANATGMNWTTGKFGGALDFDGVDDYVSLASPSGIPDGNEYYTISAWIRPDVMSTEGIVGWGTWSTQNAVNAFRLTSNGLLNYWWSNDLAVTTGDLSGVWHHVVALFDGTTRKIYVDGVLKGSDTPTGHNAVLSNFRIGSTNNGEYFDGKIDDVRIYNYARSSAQIMEDYLNGAAARLGD